MSSPALFPADWIRTADEAADDLELAVLLVNSLDQLSDPADRLTTIDWFIAVLAATGHAEQSAALRPADVPALRVLREGLQATFTAGTAEAAAAALNPLLLAAQAIPVLVVAGPDDDAALAVAPDAAGAAALAARLPAAVAGFIAQQGLRRLGSCAARPCTCVYVDRSRAANRRYCCDQCNDRAAASAYRKRQSLPYMIPTPRA